MNKWQMQEYEYGLLEKYSKGKHFAIETGSGKSTKYIAKNFPNNNTVSSNKTFFSINIMEPKPRFDDARYIIGWSVTENDIVKTFEKKSRYKDQPEDRILKGSRIKGRKDIIREVINSYGPPDFFFCDTGEYCGYAEWLIVKDIMKSGSIFAAHDICYPKSIKCYRVLADIEKSNDWKVLEKTESVQGMLIAERV